MGGHVLKLYVAGRTPRSEETITGVRAMCDRELRDDYELVVIDVLDRPHIAEKDRVLVVPTLVKESPPPTRRVIGDFSDKERLLAALGLDRRKDAG